MSVATTLKRSKGGQLARMQSAAGNPYDGRKRHAAPLVRGMR
ncbi:hypothetical protein [Mesorhizobium sp. M0767]